MILDEKLFENAFSRSVKAQRRKEKEEANSADNNLPKDLHTTDTTDNKSLDSADKVKSEVPQGTDVQEFKDDSLSKSTNVEKSGKYTVKIIADHNRGGGLRAQTDDGKHGKAFTAFPKVLRGATGQEYTVDELTWVPNHDGHGGSYRIKGKIYTDDGAVYTTKGLKESFIKSYTINDNWSNYDKAVAKAQLSDYGFIIIDTDYNTPTDNEYDIEDFITNKLGEEFDNKDSNKNIVYIVSEYSSKPRMEKFGNRVTIIKSEADSVRKFNSLDKAEGFVRDILDESKEWGSYIPFNYGNGVFGYRISNDYTGDTKWVLLAPAR